MLTIFTIFILIYTLSDIEYMYISKYKGIYAQNIWIFQLYSQIYINSPIREHLLALFPVDYCLAL